MDRMAANYESIKSQVLTAQLVCVSKKVDKQVLKQFMERTQHKVFGENYLQYPKF